MTAEDEQAQIDTQVLLSAARIAHERASDATLRAKEIVDSSKLQIAEMIARQSATQRGLNLFRDSIDRLDGTLATPGHNGIESAGNAVHVRETVVE